jgi:hypothetical protein
MKKKLLLGVLALLSALVITGYYSTPQLEANEEFSSLQKKQDNLHLVFKKTIAIFNIFKDVLHRSFNLIRRNKITFTEVMRLITCWKAKMNASIASLEFSLAQLEASFANLHHHEIVDYATLLASYNELKAHYLSLSQSCQAMQHQYALEKQDMQEYLNTFEKNLEHILEKTQANSAQMEDLFEKALLLTLAEEKEHEGMLAKLQTIFNCGI